MFGNMRVLVAEDNPSSQTVAVTMLQLIGCTVDVVSCGRDAVTMVSQHHYDVVFMDCNMPDMNGFEATSEIRRLEGSNKHTIVIALTANAIKGFREKCLAAGMDDYLSKPIRSSKLEEVIARWAAPYRRYSKRLPIPSVAESIRETASGTVFDEARLQKLLRTFKKTGKDFVPAVVDPYLKGGSKNLGLQKLSEICSGLQDNATKDDYTHVRELVIALERELPLVKAYVEDMRGNSLIDAE